MNTRSIIAAFSYSALVLLMGCFQEDHWRHYQGGGSYVTLTPDCTSDGQTVVFSSPATGHGDIYEYRCADQHLQLLVSTPQMDTSPLLTTGGKLFYESKAAGVSIIYCRDNSTGITFPVSDPGKCDELESVSPDGKHYIAMSCKRSGGLGKLVNLVVRESTPSHPTTIELGTCAASFSSDGKWIIVRRYDSDAHPIIELLNRNGEVHRTFGRGDLVTLTPHGQLAVVRDSAKSEIEFVNLDGNLESKMTVDAPIDLSFHFSPFFAESSIIFITKSTDGRELWSKRYSDHRETMLCQLPKNFCSWRPKNDVALIETRPGSDYRVNNLWRVEYARPEVKFLIDMALPIDKDQKSPDGSEKVSKLN